VLSNSSSITPELKPICFFCCRSYKDLTDDTNYKTTFAGIRMRSRYSYALLRLFFIGVFLTIAACGGGGGSAAPDTPAEPPPEPTPVSLTPAEASRFLSQATFGPNTKSIDELVDAGLESWLNTEFTKPASLHLETVLAGYPEDGSVFDEDGDFRPEPFHLPSHSFWKTAIEGDDQLRQRMAFALSQILVVSANSSLINFPQMLANYMDILTQGAFGNYRDLLESVTYSPAMAVYLTYFRNQKADPVSGRVPDENYAREFLQLFTVGLVELNSDGTPLLQADGSQVELYDNDDITELAKVFTGLSVSGVAFNAPLFTLEPEAYYSPLEGFDEFHSALPKNFLGISIPANTSAEQTIDTALDGIFAHPNLGPFVGRQLIQRFVTSAPNAEYVTRVAAAFDQGSYALPSGDSVGSGVRGDLEAVIAAVLFDPEARDDSTDGRESFGKLREPVLRFTHWARAFEVNSADASNELVLLDTSGSESLGQHPYRSSSVFNFYRPGYVAPGTETGAAGLTAPELQITNASSVVGYPNIITIYALGRSPKRLSSGEPAFVTDYSREAELASNPQALLDHLDLLLTYGTLQSDTTERITGILDALGATTTEELQLRARVASILVMTSPEYIVLR
jgi:uncharacterized protein (DUF1800 family)